MFIEYKRRYSELTGLVLGLIEPKRIAFAAENSFPFNEVVEGDRQHEAATFARYIAGQRTRGVIKGVGGALLVSESSPAALSVDITDGGAYAGLALQMRWYENTVDPLTKTIATADPTDPRIDTAVVEMDTATGVRDTVVNIITGTPAPSPVPPTLTQTEARFMLPLADIAVAASAATIVNANITDRRLFSGPNNATTAGLVHVGSDTTERSTTSVTAVDLATIALNPDPTAGELVRVTGKFRKSAGAAAVAGIGLKVNGVVVNEAVAAAAALAATGAVDRADFGSFAFEFPVGETNYAGAVQGMHAAYFTTGGSVQVNVSPSAAPTNLIPIADVATIALRGIVASASIELFVKDVHVFRYITS